MLCVTDDQSNLELTGSAPGSLVVEVSYVTSVQEIIFIYSLALALRFGSHALMFKLAQAQALTECAPAHR